ncbi:DNA recombination protein [Escherichia coli]|nr:DNA recombination protein [Escherichia coli]
MINSEQRLSEQFENLANRIFEHSNRRVDEQNRQSLNSLLSPLREQLDGFRRQVQDSFGKEAQERHTLTTKFAISSNSTRKWPRKRST